MDIPTEEQLTKWLARVNVKDAAKAAGVSEKTIYRYRWGKTFPTLDVLKALEPLLQQARKSSKAGAPAVHAEAKG